MSGAAPSLRVVAALLAQGRLLHHATLALMLAVVLLAAEPLGALLAAGALLVVGLETWIAVRVGLDAELFGRLADGLDPGVVDAGLVEAGLVRDAPARPVSARVTGALRLLWVQAGLAAAEGLLVVVALVLREVG